MRKSVSVFALVSLLVLSFFARPIMAVAQEFVQNLNYVEGPCDHFVNPVLPTGEFDHVWVTGDPATLMTSSASQQLDKRFLIEASATFTLTNVPSSNVWGCLYRGVLPQSKAAELLNGFNGEVYYVKIDPNGGIHVENFPNLLGTWTPVPTLTFTPTATATATETPTATASATATASPTLSATPAPVVYMLFLPIAYREYRHLPPPIPTATATASPTATPRGPFQEGECGQRLTGLIASGFEGSRTTSDPGNAFTLANGIVITSTHKITIVSEMPYTMSTATNTWTCNWRGTVTRDVVNNLQTAPFEAFIIGPDGAVIDRWTVGVPVPTQ